MADKLASRKKSAKPAPPALDQRLSYKVSRVNAMLGRVANPVYSALGIELLSWRLLIFLLERGEMRVGELVELSHVAQSTVSQQLKALDKRKLIKRMRSSEDNRSVTVVLTPKGREAAKQCNKVSEGVYLQMYERLGAKDADKLHELLEKAYDALVEYEQSQQTK